jgi:hypothetical protein
MEKEANELDFFFPVIYFVHMYIIANWALFHCSKKKTQISAIFEVLI